MIHLLHHRRTFSSVAYQEMYPSRFSIATTPSRQRHKIARYNTRFWSPKRQQTQKKCKKKSTHRGVCLRGLDGYVCDIKTGLKIDLFDVTFWRTRQKNSIYLLITTVLARVCLTAAIIFARLRWWGCFFTWPVMLSRLCICQDFAIGRGQQASELACFGSRGGPMRVSNYIFLKQIERKLNFSTNITLYMF